VGLAATVTFYNLGDWALRQGEISRAMNYFAEALRVGVRSGEQRGLVSALGGLARLAAAVGQLLEATGWTPPRLQAAGGRAFR
jgi:hypothetical protein